MATSPAAAATAHVVGGVKEEALGAGAGAGEYPVTGIDGVGVDGVDGVVVVVSGVDGG